RGYRGLYQESHSFVAKALHALLDQVKAGEGGLPYFAITPAIPQKQQDVSLSRPWLFRPIKHQQGLALFDAKLDTAFHGLASGLLFCFQLKPNARPCFFARPLSAPIHARSYLAAAPRPSRRNRTGLLPRRLERHQAKCPEICRLFDAFEG